MLDIRATHYVSPLAEVEFTDVPLTVRLVNGADEAGLITGRFRVYNDTTGELIFDSLIAPLTLTAGQSADVSALTPFSPPAPLDDTYFVLFDGKASNALVPRGIAITLGAFYFDVKPGPLGEPPEAHAPTHVQAGADPLETSDLGTSVLDTTLTLHPDGAGGLAWAPTVPAPHDIAGAKHTSGATPGQILQADASGLPVDASNTDTQIANVVRQTTPQTLTDQAAIDWDLALGGAAQVTLGGNRTLNAPTNLVNGARYRLKVIQDATGTRLLAWNAVYRFPGGVDPALSAAAGNIDILLFDCDGSNMDCVGMVSAVA